MIIAKAFFFTLGSLGFFILVFCMAYLYVKYLLK